MFGKNYSDQPWAANFTANLFYFVGLHCILLVGLFTIIHGQTVISRFRQIINGKQNSRLVNILSQNRPLAPRDHVTNASFKQWVGILLMPKIDRARKNYLTLEIWEEAHLREIFYGTLIFQQSSIICIGRHVGGHTLALQHGGQNFFLLRSC